MSFDQRFYINVKNETIPFSNNEFLNNDTYYY